MDFTLIWPVFRPCDQLCPHRIPPDVIPFLRVTFIPPQQMIKTPRLPETFQLRAGNGCRLMSQRKECLAQALLQTAFPPAQSHVASDADKDMNMIWHQPIASGGDIEFQPPFGIDTERIVNAVIGKQWTLEQRVESDEIERCLVTLEDDRQARWRCFELPFHCSKTVVAGFWCSVEAAVLPIEPQAQRYTDIIRNYLSGAVAGAGGPGDCGGIHSL
jgi:hypothetical protein